MLSLKRIINLAFQRNLCIKTIKTFNEIPGPKPLPIFGNTWRYLPLIGEYSLDGLHKNAFYNLSKYGSLVRERIGNTSILHVYEPDDIKTVIKHEPKYPQRRSHRALLHYRHKRSDLYSSGGLFPENGEEWYRLRKICQTVLLKESNVYMYMDSCEYITKKLIDYIKNQRDSLNEVIDFQEYLFHWALLNISILAFDKQLCLNFENCSQELCHLINAVHETHKSIVTCEYSAFDLWKYFPLPAFQKLSKAQDYIAHIVNEHLKKNLLPFNDETDEKTNLNGNERKTVLQQLLNNPNASEKDIFMLIMDLFLAGIDTTSFVSGFALYFLAKNRSTQKKLQKEIMKILPNKTSKLTEKAFHNTPYLKACVKETLRLRPVSIGVGRVTAREMTLSGYHVPSNTMVIIQSQVACRQAKNFSQPDNFIPERWFNTKNTNSVNQNNELISECHWQKPSPFLLLPFGFGPRKCIGKNFSEMEIYVLLAKIIRNFEIEYHYDDIGTFTRLINIPDKKLRLRFIDRSE